MRITLMYDSTTVWYYNQMTVLSFQSVTTLWQYHRSTEPLYNSANVKKNLCMRVPEYDGTNVWPGLSKLNS